MPESPRPLLIEDDRRRTGMLRRLLTSEGYGLTLSADGQSGMHRGLTETSEVMVIDRGLPVVAGSNVLATLRRGGVSTPTLILSARECALLGVFSRSPERVFSRDGLREIVFANAADDGVLDTDVRYPRGKLGRHVVRTVCGLGYTLWTTR